MISVCKNTMRENATEFGYQYVDLSALAKQYLKIGERVAAYNTCNMIRVAWIDERDEDLRKCKAYHLNACKYRGIVFRVASSNDYNTLKVFSIYGK